MENQENEETRVLSNFKIGVSDHGGFLMKVVVQAGDFDTQQTIVIDSDQAAFIRDFISEHLSESDVEPALPEEPEERGVYVAQTGELLAKDSDDEWSYKEPPYDRNGRWNTGCDYCDDIHTYTQDWDAVVDTIGSEAFPLKRVTKERLVEFAQSGVEVARPELEEPEEFGVYRTQTGMLLIKAAALGWMKLPEDPEDPDEPLFKWQPEDISVWTEDWCDVLFTLGEEEFPLCQLSDNEKVYKHAE